MKKNQNLVLDRKVIQKQTITKSYFFNYFFQWYILNNISPRSIHLANEKTPKTSDEITYVQNYNTESIHFYHLGIQSGNYHIQSI